MWWSKIMMTCTNFEVLQKFLNSSKINLLQFYILEKYWVAKYCRNHLCFFIIKNCRKIYKNKKVELHNITGLKTAKSLLFLYYLAIVIALINMYHNKLYVVFFKMYFVQLNWQKTYFLNWNWNKFFHLKKLGF
jgi:hypothetical protein